VVSFGEMLYRSWDAVLRVRQQGLDVGLINKPSLNVVDEQVRFEDVLECQTLINLSRRCGRLGRAHSCSLSSPLTKRLGCVSLCFHSLFSLSAPSLTNSLFSSALNSGRGSSSGSSPRATVTWARPAKVRRASRILFMRRQY
jgi:hypothetical protein